MYVGIPVHNDLESFKEMIQSFLNSTNAYDKIIIVESGKSTDGAYQFCDYLQATYNKVEVYHANTKTPLDAYNMLFDMAIEDGHDLLITQTDVIFPKMYKRDWLSVMQKIAKISDVGAITCINGTGLSGPSYIDGFEWLGGWCTYFTHRALKKVGGYDKQYPSGYGVDIDHTYRLVKANFKIVKINYWVDHHKMNERPHDNSPDSEKMKQKAAKRFKKKWSLS